jgi:hypothetical protein
VHENSADAATTALVNANITPHPTNCVNLRSRIGMRLGDCGGFAARKGPLITELETIGFRSQNLWMSPSRPG